MPEGRNKGNSGDYAVCDIVHNSFNNPSAIFSEFVGPDLASILRFGNPRGNKILY